MLVVVIIVVRMLVMLVAAVALLVLSIYCRRHTLSAPSLFASQIWGHTRSGYSSPSPAICGACLHLYDGKELNIFFSPSTRMKIVHTQN